MTDIDHMIAMLQAYKEGKTIQCRYRSNGADDWVDVRGIYQWNWYMFDYRVKPAEPRRVWLNFYPTMGGRSSVCYDSREEAASLARHDITEQIEFVEVVCTSTAKQMTDTPIGKAGVT